MEERVQELIGKVDFLQRELVASREYNLELKQEFKALAESLQDERDRYKALYESSNGLEAEADDGMEQDATPASQPADPTTPAAAGGEKTEDEEYAARYAKAIEAAKEAESSVKWETVRRKRQHDEKAGGPTKKKIVEKKPPTKQQAEPQPGPSSAPQPGPSTAPQPGASTTPQPGPSMAPQPGPSMAPQPATKTTSTDIDIIAESQPLTEKSAVGVAKAKAVPPIVLREKAVWPQLQRTMKEMSISYTKARNTEHGIAITTATIEGYRRLIDHLEKVKLQFHCYTLRADKPLKVVFRGLPEFLDVKEIEAELKEQGLPVTQVARMKTTREGQRVNLPLVLVEVPRENRQVYQTNRLMGLVVKPEALRKRTTPGQCHRCQLFGHTQRNCRADPRCVKCAGPHRGFECTRPRSQPATCCNCGGAHPSSAERCPYRVRIFGSAGARTAATTTARTPTPKQQTTAPAPTSSRPSAKVQPGTSFAEKARGSSGRQATPSHVPEEQQRTKKARAVLTDLLCSLEGKVGGDDAKELLDKIERIASLLQ